MTPKGKAEFVYGLRREGRKVSMVGDGINDAPALAASDAGMAFKRGLDVAGEAASVILMSDRLGQVSQKLNVRFRCGLPLEFHARWLTVQLSTLFFRVMLADCMLLARIRGENLDQHLVHGQDTSKYPLLMAGD